MKLSTFTKILLYGIPAFVLFISCTKEYELKENRKLDPTVIVKNNRLTFKTLDSFKNTIAQLQQQENPEFDEETKSFLENEGFKGLNYTYNKICNDEINYSKSFANLEFAEDTLIEDPYFAALLNEDREIEVGGFIYKIDEYGTFFGPAEKIQEINSIIDELDQSDVIDFPGELVTEKLYRVGDDIYLYDSFNINEPDSIGSSVEIIEIPDPALSPGSSSVYGDIATYQFDAKTLAGKAIQFLFGRSKAHNREFNWRRRIRVNFYSVNYVVYSAIGLNVKFQKKNWIGWSKTECSELRWGWDALVYKYNLPYSMPSTGPGVKRIDKSGVPGLQSKLAYTVNILEREINIDFSKPLREVTLGMWDWMERSLAPQAYEMRQENLKQFRVLFPNKAKVVVDRYEEVRYNCESLSKVFDWGTCEVSINFLSGGRWVFDPGLKNNAMDFDVTKVSIYGIAKYDGKYKGVRIMKD